MRILVSTYHKTIVGGAETYVRAILQNWVSKGVSIAFLHECKAYKASNNILEGLDDIYCICTEGKSTDDVLNEVSTWGPTLIFNQGLKNTLLEEKMTRNWPTFFFAHSFYGTCISGTKRIKSPHLKPCNKILGPACIFHYLPSRCGGLNPLIGIKAYRSAIHQKKILLKYEGILVASHWMYQEFQRHGVPPDRLHYVPYFPSTVGSILRSPQVRPLQNTLLFAGRIAENKGWRHALEATKAASIALNKDLRLIVAGDGPDLEAMKNASNKLGLKPEYLGWINGPKLQETFQAVDLLLMPSLWPEPFGLLGIEAGSFGLPSAGYAVGGITDWLVPGQSGECGTPGEMKIEELTKAIMRALEDQDHWQSLREGAWRKSQEFTSTRHFDSLTKIFFQK